MLIDARSVDWRRGVDTDVAIVGGGAAGLALSLALQARRVHHVILEAGGETFDRTSQEFYRAGSIQPTSHGSTHIYRRRMLGGTTSIWGGRCIPFDPIDFEARDWIPYSDWPLRYEDVAEHYLEAMRICRAGEPFFDAKSAGLKPPYRILEDVSPLDAVLDRIERFSEPTNFAQAYANDIRSNAFVRVMTYAPVVELLTNRYGSSCTGCRVRLASGNQFVVRAARTVVAAGGLETPRLLLASMATHARGLGNETDVVGRFYQAHLEGEMGSIHFTGLPRHGLIDYEMSADGIYCRRYIWLSPEAQRRERLAGLVLRPAHPEAADPVHRDAILSAMFLAKSTIIPEYRRRLAGSHKERSGAEKAGTLLRYAYHLRNVALQPRRLVDFSADWLVRRVLAKRKLPSVFLKAQTGTYPLDMNSEQIPNPESRVFLSSELDPHGVARLSVDWRMSADDKQNVRRSMTFLAESFRASNSASIDLRCLEEHLDGITRIGGHHIGTARMGSSSARAVVDCRGEVYGVNSLFICGAATFPTSGFANPTLTIVALALRLGSYLAATPSSN